MIRPAPRRLATRTRYVWLLVLAVSGGCGLVRRPPPVVDRSHDPRILQEVQARLAAEPTLDASQLRVEVDGGVVLLYGSVPGIGGWQCAIRNAQLVEGVLSVGDFLIIERTAARAAVCLAPAARPARAVPGT